MPFTGGWCAKEVAAAAGVDEVDLRRIVLAAHVHRAVDAALRA